MSNNDNQNTEIDLEDCLENTEDKNSKSMSSEEDDKNKSKDIPKITTPFTGDLKKVIKLDYPIEKIVSIDPNKVALSLPSVSEKILSKSLANAIKDDAVDEKVREWISVIAEGGTNSPVNGTFNDALNDPDKDFKQKIETSGIDIEPSKVALKPSSKKMSKDSALVRTLDYIGAGNVITVPLIHSGIWVSMRPPTEVSILELQQTIINDKITLGRASYGITYSNTLSTTVNRLVSFALDHIMDSTLVVSGEDDRTLKEVLLEDVIVVHDLYTLIWALAWSIYPDGFEYNRACVYNADKCRYIAQAKLNISKLLFIDKSSLKDEHLDFMLDKSPRSKTLEKVKAYQKSIMQPGSKFDITASNGNVVRFNIKNPYIGEYITKGEAWVKSIVNDIEKALGVEADDDLRERFIANKARATTMNQLNYWVESIILKDQSPIDEPDVIESTLAALSADENIRNDFIKRMQDYINKAAMSVIGIPSYRCPSCGKSYVPDEDQRKGMENIIPIDVINVFFSLVGYKVTNITARPL